METARLTKPVEKVDRSAIPQNRVFLSSQFESWEDYLKHTSSVSSLYKKREKIKKTKSLFVAKKLPGTAKRKFNPHLAHNRDKFKFAYPELHVGLSSKDKNYIIDNMQRNIWASLQFGATGRHVSKIKGVHHEHLMPHMGVFAFTYISLGVTDPRSDKPIARAMIYNFARETVKDSTNVLYKWTYQPDFTSPGDPNGGPPPVPYDLKYLKVGARPPNNPNRNKPSSKKRKKSNRPRRR